MAQNTTKTLAAATWTQITNADVTTAITFQNVGNSPIKLKPMTTATDPTDDTGAVIYMPGEGSQGKTLVEIWPGLTGADRLYAYAENGGRLMVSHA